MEIIKDKERLTYVLNNLIPIDIREIILDEQDAGTIELKNGNTRTPSLKLSAEIAFNSVIKDYLKTSGFEVKISKNKITEALLTFVW